MLVLSTICSSPSISYLVRGLRSYIGRLQYVRTVILSSCFFQQFGRSVYCRVVEMLDRSLMYDIHA